MSLSSNIAIGPYYNSSLNLQELCHQLKVGDHGALTRAAELLLSVVPDGATIIPIPSRSGLATITRSICEIIVQYNDSIVIFDCLTGNNRESVYQLKKMFPYRVLKNDFFGFKSSAVPPVNGTFLFDTVYATGSTINAAREALGFDCPYIVLAQDVTKNSNCFI